MYLSNPNLRQRYFPRIHGLHPGILEDKTRTINTCAINNADYGQDAYDYTKWDVVDRIGNIYNRLILYPGEVEIHKINFFSLGINITLT